MEVSTYLPTICTISYVAWSGDTLAKVAFLEKTYRHVYMQIHASIGQTDREASTFLFCRVSLTDEWTTTYARQLRVNRWAAFLYYPSTCLGFCSVTSLGSCSPHHASIVASRFIYQLLSTSSHCSQASGLSKLPRCHCQVKS